MPSQHLIRSLGLLDTISIVIGTILGTGVFLKTATMSQSVNSPYWVLLAWLCAGALSLMGALSYAELGCMFPDAGGEYVYLRNAYGNLPAFLYGWMRFWIASPASIAAYAVAAATFLLGGFSDNRLGVHSIAAVAIGMIIFFSVINCMTVAFAGRIQTFLTVLKTGAIVGLVGAIFLFSPTGSWDHWQVVQPGSDGPSWSAFSAAMFAALWAYDGWNNMPMIAGEVKNPQRNIPISLGLGMLVILLIYGLTNIAYFYALPFEQILTANSATFPKAPAVATLAAQTFLGPLGLSLLTFGFVFTVVGAMNGSILTGSRVPYAMAKDELFFKKLALLSPKTQVPVWSILIQGALSCLLAASGSFDRLTDYVVFSSWIFYAACAGAVIWLRKKYPDTPRPYRVPLYPVLPLIFIVGALFLLANAVYSSPWETMIGIILIVLGIPAYHWFRLTGGK